MIMILFRNYPLSFTGICAPIVPENEIISLLIMMTYDFHCQICRSSSRSSSPFIVVVVVVAVSVK